MSHAELIACAQETIGYQFSRPDLLVRALTHASIAKLRLESNERLEFLGDAILGMVVCHELYNRFGRWLEGDLTKVKSVVVSRRICAKISDEIGLTKLLILGNGISAQNHLPVSVRAAVLEAVIGAVFLDGGLEKVKAFILQTVTPYIEACAVSQDNDNYKSALQQYVQRHLSATPRYEPLDEQGPDHSKCFEICVIIAGERFPSAWGASKKAAEQEAAKRALEALRSAEVSRAKQEEG